MPFVVPEQLKIIASIHPKTSSISLLESGEMNDMILVDGTEIFRFPRTDESQRRLHYESKILNCLNNSLQTSIPKLLHFDDKVPFSILSFIKGEPLNPSEIQQLPKKYQKKLAIDLALFMRELNDRLDVGDLDKWTDQLMANPETWDDYYQRIATGGGDDFYAKKYRSQYAKVLKLREQLPVVPVIAIHGDLHAGNMLFSQGKLTGIIDFGDCETGTIYNELRPLYNSFGEGIVRQVISELGDQLGKVSLDLVREFAIMHELSVLARSDLDQLRESTRVETARNLLNQWLGKSWDENATSVKAIIFDCFGVLTSEAWIPFRKRHFKTDDKKAFAKKMMNLFVTGHLKLNEFVSVVAKKGDVEEDDVRASLSGSCPDTELFEWIAQNNTRYKMGILSNAGVDRLSTLFTSDQLALFDDIVLSYKVGIAKPSPDVYKHAADRLGVTPQECVFVDDKELFCVAARSVGMKAVQYRGFGDFQQKVSDMTM